MLVEYQCTCTLIRSPFLCLNKSEIDTDIDSSHLNALSCDRVTPNNPLFEYEQLNNATHWVGCCMLKPVLDAPDRQLFAQPLLLITTSGGQG